MFPATLVISLPKISVNSSSENKDIFKQNLPVSSAQHRRKLETFPWTVTSEDLAVFTLFPDEEQLQCDSKVETIYVCKPVSWNLLLASASPSSAVSKNVANLGVITENSNDSAKSASKSSSYSAIVQEKYLASSTERRTSLGFVLHIDWSMCECFLSQKQVFKIMTFFSS